MSNDLDDLDAALRRAMAALDGEAPPGYFEALPARTLARLDEAPGSAAASMPSAELPGRRRSRRVRAAIVGVGGIGLAAAVAVIYLGSHAGVGSAPPTVAGDERAVGTSDPAAASSSAGGGSSMTSVAAGSATSAEPIAPAGGTASGSAPTAPAIAVGAGSSAGSDLASGPPPEPVGKLAVPVIKRPGNAKAPSKSGGGKLQVEVPAGTEGDGSAAAGSGAATGADRPGEDAQQSPDKPGPSGKKLKSNKPRPDRTSLSSDDIERAMTAVAGKARACAAGTSGTASLRLTVAPSGRIAQVTVTGPLAGTPVGACVERAVRTATFLPWDGASQSFDYSYPLSD